MSRTRLFGWLAARARVSVVSALVRELTAAPDLDGWLIVERLLKDLAPLDDLICQSRGGQGEQGSSRSSDPLLA